MKSLEEVLRFAVGAEMDDPSLRQLTQLVYAELHESVGLAIVNQLDDDQMKRLDPLIGDDAATVKFLEENLPGYGSISLEHRSAAVRRVADQARRGQLVVPNWPSVWPRSDKPVRGPDPQ